MHSYLMLSSEKVIQSPAGLNISYHIIQIIATLFRFIFHQDNPYSWPKSTYFSWNNNFPVEYPSSVTDIEAV